ncbi:type III-A CRISPR-associated RAMP protein Csm4 [Desulfofundulus sp.]|uniref:type III-A CRISPR-associated RAMP protein Csm4 n=1 Tax=Desulfofundulus sp. TaxID=2282750 RepID=UPI003C778E82
MGSCLTPLHADTIFGGLCWTLKYSEGEGALSNFLSLYRNGLPPLVISNGFPGDLFPRPLLPLKKGSLPTSRLELIAAAKEGKRVKKIEYITLEEFITLASGRDIMLLSREKPFMETVTLHNQINRLTGTTGEEGSLYEQVERYIHTDYSHLSIYLKISRGWEEKVLRLFQLLGETGLGKRKSIGKGSFSVVALEEFKAFNDLDQANGFISLSNFVPAGDDPVDGRYRMIVKYGKLGEEYALSALPFKRPLLMIRAGSAFRTTGNIKPFYGKMVEGIAPGHPGVLHYGLAFAVPTRMEEARC